MEAVSAIKDIIVLGFQIQRSIEKVRGNQKTTSRLSTEIARDLCQLESLLDGYSFRNGYKLYAALDLVKQEMMMIHEECMGFMTKPETTKVWSSTKMKFKAWRKRDQIETRLARLENRVRDCLSRFTAHSTMRTEGTSHRMEHALIGHIAESRIQTQRIGGILETYLIGTSHGAQIVEQVAAIGCSDLSHKSIEYQYLHVLVTRVLEMVHSSARQQDCTPIQSSQDASSDHPYEAVDEFHSQPIIVVSRTSQEPQNVIFYILEILANYKHFGNEILMQCSAWTLRDLSVSLYTLQSLQNEAMEVHSWAVKIYRSLARSETSFLPYLALSLSTFASKDSDISEAYTICTSIHNTLPELYSPSLELHILIRHANCLLQWQQFVECLPIAQSAVRLCRELWVLPVAPMGWWKQGDPRSPQTDDYIQTVCTICLALSWWWAISRF
ncbi:hypothetical protein C8J56DRAFT_478645 [Mycena floridula]|nr:hypothetical protein C8J56DRAFT_478645 [Mycena floridula]